MSSKDSILDLFYRLEKFRLSGFEEPMMVIHEISPTSTRYGTPRGNVIAVQGGTPGAEVALVSHLDQIGFIVFNIDAAGFVRFRKIRQRHARHTGSTPDTHRKKGQWWASWG
jgi:putative aminopeptidase FrvX